MPGRSKESGLPRDSGTMRAAAVSPAMPMGRLTRNTGRQSQPLRFQAISSPPASGPRAVASPATAP